MAGLNLATKYYMECAQSEFEHSTHELESLKSLTNKLILSSDWQTRFSRAYLATTDITRKIAFNKVNDIIEGKLAPPDNYNLQYWNLAAGGYADLPRNYTDHKITLENQFIDQGANPEELILIDNAHTLFRKITNIQRVAINAIDGRFDDGTGAYSKTSKPDPTLAHELLYGVEYLNLTAIFNKNVDELLGKFDERLVPKIQSYRAISADYAAASTYINAALFSVLMLSLVYLHFNYSRRGTYLMAAVNDIARGHFTKRIPVTGNDEIRDLAIVINDMANSLYAVFEKSENKARIAENTLVDMELERFKSEKLLHNIMPPSIAKRLLKGEESLPEIHPEVTVLFADIVGFTELSASLGPAETVQLLNDIFGKFDELAEKNCVEKIKTIGDNYMVVGGVPNRDPLHCRHVADFAIQAISFIASFSKNVKYPLQMRIGIHTGTVAAGIVGKNRFSYDLWGDAVNVASRYESTSDPNKIHISESVRIRLDDEYLFADGGDIYLKGKGLTKSYFLLGRRETFEPEYIS